jgi:hypothetical protein
MNKHRPRCLIETARFLPKVPSPSRVGKGRRRGPPPIRRRPSPINTVLLLVAQGTADTVNPPGAALSFTTGRMGQNDTLTWLVPGQLVPYSGANASEAGPSALKDAVYRRVVARVRTEFFEAELSATSPTRQAATRSLAKAEDVSSVADGYVRPPRSHCRQLLPGRACMDGPAHRSSRPGRTQLRRRRSESFLPGPNIMVGISAGTCWATRRADLGRRIAHRWRESGGYASGAPPWPWCSSLSFVRQGRPNRPLQQVNRDPTSCSS